MQKFKRARENKEINDGDLREPNSRFLHITLTHENTQVGIEDSFAIIEYKRQIELNQTNTIVIINPSGQ